MIKEISMRTKEVANKICNKTEDLIETGLDNGSINTIATCIAAYGVCRNYKKYISCKEDSTWHKICKLNYGLGTVYSVIMVVVNTTYAVYYFGKNVLHIGSSDKDDHVVEN